MQTFPSLSTNFSKPALMSVLLAPHGPRSSAYSCPASQSLFFPQVTPGLGVVAVLLLFLVVQEPPRGAVERHSGSPPLSPTSWWADLKALARK